ncbi:MAG: bifunctional diguanylate cyclase/phosphodiesterase [Pseudomonadota bacterium]
MVRVLSLSGAALTGWALFSAAGFAQEASVLAPNAAPASVAAFDYLSVLSGAMLGALLLCAAVLAALAAGPSGGFARLATGALVVSAIALYVATKLPLNGRWSETAVMAPGFAQGLAIAAGGLHLAFGLRAARGSLVLALALIAVALFGAVTATLAWIGTPLSDIVMMSTVGVLLGGAFILAAIDAARGGAAAGVALPGVLAIAVGAALLSWRDITAAPEGFAPMGPLAALTLGGLIVGFSALAAHRARQGAKETTVVGSLGGQELAELLDFAGLGVWDWTARTDKVAASAGLRSMLGDDIGAADPEVSWRARIAPEDASVYEEVLKGGDAAEDGPFDVELRVAAEDGTIKPLRFRGARAVDGGSGKLRRVAAIVETGGRGAHAAPSEHAEALTPVPTPVETPNSADALTGLPLRSALFEEMAVHPEGGLLLLGVDRFRSVNQALGFAGGDSLLAEIARRLNDAAADHGFVARPDGDTFAVFAPGRRDEDELLSGAEELRKRIAGAVLINDQEVIPSVSIGVAAWEDGLDDETVYARAENAMYAAKEDGGGRVVAYARDMGRSATATLSLETDLRRALERGEIEVHYQPVIRLADGAAAGFEALARWRHAQRGLIAPGEFIQFAEQTDLIGPISRAVLTQAAEDLALWRRDTGQHDIFVSVNIDSRQLLRPGLEEAVSEAIFAYGLPPHALRIEVTESQIMADPDAASAILRRLSEAGAGLSLDDFGTGFSSLAYLQQFDFDSLKIDQSFVIGMDTDPTAVKIARAIIDLAHDLSMKVIAEGAETEASARRLRAMGCEFAQGFIFGAAMTSEEACAFIRSYARAAE